MSLHSSGIVVVLWLLFCGVILAEPGTETAANDTPELSREKIDDSARGVTDRMEYDVPVLQSGLQDEEDTGAQDSIYWEAARSLFDTLRVTAGVRFLRVKLRSAVKGMPYEDSFVGSIYKLNAEQQYTSFRPYMQVTAKLGLFRLGAGVGLDGMKVETDDDAGGDGDLRMKMRTLYLLAAVPNDSWFTPYAEWGKLSSNNSFAPLPAWSEDGKRSFDFENTSESYYAVGCEVALSDHVKIDVYYRRVDMDVDGVYTFLGDSREPEDFTFTVGHSSYGAGLAYTF